MVFSGQVQFACSLQVSLKRLRSLSYSFPFLVRKYHSMVALPLRGLRMSAWLRSPRF